MLLMHCPGAHNLNPFVLYLSAHLPGWVTWCRDIQMTQTPKNCSQNWLYLDPTPRDSPYLMVLSGTRAEYGLAIMPWLSNTYCKLCIVVALVGTQDSMAPVTGLNPCLPGQIWRIPSEPTSRTALSVNRPNMNLSSIQVCLNPSLSQLHHGLWSVWILLKACHYPTSKMSF